MLMYTYIVVLILNIIMLLLKRKSKLILILDFIFIFLMFYGTTTTNDYQYYLLMYEKGLSRTSYEIGFNFLLDITKMLGLSFQGFMGFVWIFFGGIILFVFSRYSNNYPLFFTCYLIYIAFIDIVQLKSFCASALLLCAFHFQFKNNKILFLLFNILAASIHIEMIFFLPLVFFDTVLLKSEAFLKKSGVAILVLCVFFFFERNTLNRLVNTIGIIFMSPIDELEKTGYFSTTGNFGFLLYFSLQFAIIIATNYGRKKLKADRRYNIINLEIIRKIQLVQLYCLFSFPLIMVNMNFYRLYRVIAYVNFIAWAIELDNFKGTTVNYYKSLFVILLTNVFYRIPLVQGNNQIDIILDNNSLIK